MAITGACLYGVSNVAQEFLIKTSSRVEYLGFIGFFASIISGIQVCLVEREALMSVDFSQFQIILCYFGFAVSMLIFYSLVAILVEATSATFFNLSVLTADFYTLIVSVLVFKFQLSYLYFFSFALIITGVILYSIKPTPQRSSESIELSEPNETDSDSHERSPGSIPGMSRKSSVTVDANSVILLTCETKPSNISN